NLADGREASGCGAHDWRVARNRAAERAGWQLPHSFCGRHSGRRHAADRVPAEAAGAASPPPTTEMMMISRRTFLSLAGAVAVVPNAAQRGRGSSDATGTLPPSIAALPSMRDRATPVTADERRARIER